MTGRSDVAFYERWSDDRWHDHKRLMAALVELVDRDPDAGEAVSDLLAAADGGSIGFYHTEYTTAVDWAKVDRGEGWSGDAW